MLFSLTLSLVYVVTRVFPLSLEYMYLCAWHEEKEEEEDVRGCES